MTVLFSDIRSFTDLSESMTPEENFSFINRYLNVMGPIDRRHNGFIDKYIGDAIMALFNTPDDAVNAATAMLLALEPFNQGHLKKFEKPVSIGIGLHKGMVRLGTIGESGRMDVTVISDTVNLASRVETLTFGTCGRLSFPNTHKSHTCALKIISLNYFPAVRKISGQMRWATTS